MTRIYRWSLILLFLLVFLPFSGAQKGAESGSSLVYLKNSGGVLVCQKVDSLAGDSLELLLVSGVLLKLPAEEVASILPSANEWMLLPNGRILRKQGWYFSTVFRMMGAEKNSFNYRSYRIFLGISCSEGYRFSPELGVGIGFGSEPSLHYRVLLIPVFVEAGGSFSYAYGKATHPQKTYLPVSWKFQLGYNVPAPLERSQMARYIGSWLIHPSLGVLFFTKRSNTVELTTGYRIQSYMRILELPNETLFRDRIWMNSLSFDLRFNF